MRLFLLVLTNLAVVLLAGLVMNLLGITPYLSAHGYDFRQLLAAGAVVGFTGAIFSLCISKWVAKRTLGVRVIDTPASAVEQWLTSTVAELAAKAGIRTPQVGVFASAEPNAFATGARRHAALVAVSTGLLEHFPPEEVRAVLGHEIGHVANGDMITLTLIQGVVNTFVFVFARVIGRLVDQTLNRDSDTPGAGYYVGSFVAQIALSALATIVVMWFSRRREYRADAAGATLAGREAMTNALRRLSGVSGPAGMPAGLAASGIRGDGGFFSLFASHPPLKSRIAALSR